MQQLYLKTYHITKIHQLCKKKYMKIHYLCFQIFHCEKTDKNMLINNFIVIKNYCIIFVCLSFINKETRKEQTASIIQKRKIAL